MGRYYYPRVSPVGMIIRQRFGIRYVKYEATQGVAFQRGESVGVHNCFPSPHIYDDPIKRKVGKHFRVNHPARCLGCGKNVDDVIYSLAPGRVIESGDTVSMLQSAFITDDAAHLCHTQCLELARDFRTDSTHAQNCDPSLTQGTKFTSLPGSRGRELGDSVNR